MPGVRGHASGTPVLGAPGSTTLRGDPRYLAEEAVLVGSHLRPWSQVLVALSANSPFWAERDTRYASWRTMVAHALPVFGPPPHFSSAEHFDQVAADLLEAEAVVDEGMLLVTRPA
ncbi:glutamate-cysteine ligase family protein [Streptomyces lancefieldiae]|uniref:Glutamate-cysteine ligase family protein n=1 Tax=Streptomyces lancefieldiae TaxID=3075520 RepID=A0ABU3ANR0_9ACTN|nr:glutamate-cysteine ligase family protein [Streptomyces sp. DSM 40712]MDT0611831.1 glutamate-cysteine ligase family protein [Streptomyces sp. DSM 40712]